MMEDLQQAYAAYQQALYHLRDPQVSASISGLALAHMNFDRSLNYGTALAFFTIAMDLSSMPKKHSRR